jgi:monomeric sarcosine oxidase
MSREAPFDLVIVGLGVMGLATAYQAVRANPALRVLGLEQFDLMHDRGSSHGESRLTRQAYSEGLAYVPLMLDAHREWDELGRAAGEQLLHRSGVLYVSSDAEGEVIRGAKRSADTFSLPGVSVLSGAQVRAQFPGTLAADGEVALHEAGGGWLAADKIRSALHRLSVERGAVFRFNTAVGGWRALPDGTVAVSVAEGRQEVVGKSLVLTAGAWTQRFVPGLELHPRRAVLSWFEVEEAFVEERRRGPGFMMERAGHEFIYGFPASQHDGRWLLKCAWHYAPNLTHQTSPEPDCDPDAVRRDVSEAEVAGVERAIKSLFRGIGKRVKSKTCMYNNSHDCDFVIDALPGFRNVVVASGFSGHGFKFAITVGKIVAGLAQGRRPEWDISAFRLQRPHIYARL